VKLPLLLIVVATLSGGVVAYGTYPRWMQYPHGLDIILWSRRLQWLLVSVSLIASILLIALAISGRRRAWWLIGLAPVLALFFHRFSNAPAIGRMLIVDNPHFISAAEAKIADDEWVVGVKFGDANYVYRYSTLFAAPVIIQADHDKRMILIWSAYANRALAMPIGHDLRARDLEVVSTPANALLLYNSRSGQFINGLTGETTRHERPAGFSDATPLFTEKLPWKDWKARHQPPANMGAKISDDPVRVLDRVASPLAEGPSVPIQPSCPMPPLKLDRPAEERVALVGFHDPAMIETEDLAEVENTAPVDAVPLVIFRDEENRPLRAFARQVMDENRQLVPVQLAVNEVVALPAGPMRRPRRAPPPRGQFIDINSNTGWNADGACVDDKANPQFKGRKLAPVHVDEGLPFAVMKFWYPNLAPPVIIETKLELVEPEPSPVRQHKVKHKKPEVRSQRAEISNANLISDF
jgi:hypothetical protein